ncbi:hypothetical protein BTO32_00820 [Marinobacter lutaoensis]|uniref:Sulfotransferase family protein n=1 Tax=Marinobacter lutaoensis TaxID=135739 RepID=A0A1V2DWA3_9GAMM|nr:sulfotransferase [Marinobacter lutaoensis]ONF45054.1 hypothetical protein BTO32_00820 [Marinobacter lutaoensis]
MNVVLVNGYGRSGSTVIEAVLSKRSEIFPVGEMRNIWERGLLGYRCSCERSILDCDFWSKVIGSVSDEKSLADFFLKMESIRYKYDRIRNFWKIQSLERVPDDLQWYIKKHEEMYEIICDESNKSIVLDSSKNPTHAAILSKSKRINIKNIHLVRHPRAVVYSWSRKKIRKESPDLSFMPRHSFYKSSALWLVMNAQSEKVMGENFFLRYEDFVNSPEDAIKSLREYIGCSGHGEPVNNLHTIGGNPVKFDSGFTNIKPDMEWKKKQRKLDAALTWAMTFWMAKKYGYSYDG